MRKRLRTRSMRSQLEARTYFLSFPISEWALATEPKALQKRMSAHAGSFYGKARLGHPQLQSPDNRAFTHPIVGSGACNLSRVRTQKRRNPWMHEMQDVGRVRGQTSNPSSSKVYMIAMHVQNSLSHAQVKAALALNSAYRRLPQQKKCMP